MARAGSAHPVTPYDAVRYQRIAVLAEELRASRAATAGGDHVSVGDAGDRAVLEARTPVAAGDAAVFDPRGRILLIQRTDSRLWALPGGAADVGDRPAAVAEREAWEETGVRVQAERLIGLYFRPGRGPARGLCLFVFLCRYLEGEPVVTHETLDVGYFSAADLPPLHGAHDRIVGDAFAAHSLGEAWATVCV